LCTFFSYFIFLAIVVVIAATVAVDFGPTIAKVKNSFKKLPAGRFLGQLN